MFYKQEMTVMRLTVQVNLLKSGTRKWKTVTFNGQEVKDPRFCGKEHGLPIATGHIAKCVWYVGSTSVTTDYQLAFSTANYL